MKTRILWELFKIYNTIIGLFYKRKKKLLIYTDSRGFNVISNLGKSPFTSYISKLIYEYKIDYYICPEKFTTIIDFLFLLKEKGWKNYDYVIMHCGVVDFSPRPLSNISKLKNSKQNKKHFRDLFAENALHYTKYMGPKYNDEDLVTLYSEEYFINYVCPLIKDIKNLIWIDSNHFVKGWEGNFFKGRPININETVNKFDMILTNYVSYKITLKNWSDLEVKKFTIDNIHFSNSGFNELIKLIKHKLSDIT